MHVQAVLIPLLHLLVQLLQQLRTFLRDWNPKIRDPVAPGVDKLALLRYILVLVFDEVGEVWPLKI